MVADAGLTMDRIRPVDIGGLEVTPFAQDICVCLTPRDAAPADRFVFLEPLDFQRRDDREICDRVGAALSHDVRASGLEFQGGNLLCTDRHILIGADHFEANREAMAPTDPTAPEQAVRMAFKTSLDDTRALFPLGAPQVPVPRPIVRPGGSRKAVHYIHPSAIGLNQPIFHIDMFVTPLGPIGGIPTALVGKPTPSHQHGPEVDLLAGLPFDTVVRALESAGYRVLRNPITTATLRANGQPRRVRDLSPSDDIEGALRESVVAQGAQPTDHVEIFEHHILTWNNVIVENRGSSGLHVVMPTYDHPHDAECAAIYESLGARVSRLPDMTRMVALRGAAHCMVRDVARHHETDADVGPRIA